ncbi:MAG: MoaD/ThiS family protein [Methanomicrobia archaeon]|nr:MoaD/ThiS family protein [Methanomicrobia archaeon]
MGKKELNIELKETMTVNELMKMLIAEYPKLSEFTDYTMILLNHVYSDGTELIKDGDEVALFPPLDGG